MQPTGALHDLRTTGHLRQFQTADGWTADPTDVISALAHDGFTQCKREEARDPHHHAGGGVWQGLNHETGAVAVVTWICGAAREPLVFIDIDGEPVREG